jgi:hypothetical protein
VVVVVVVRGAAGGGVMMVLVSCRFILYETADQPPMHLVYCIVGVCVHW